MYKSFVKTCKQFAYNPEKDPDQQEITELLNIYQSHKGYVLDHEFRGQIIQESVKILKMCLQTKELGIKD